jgi:hypothetical protein
MVDEIVIEYRPVRKVVILDLMELNNQQLFDRVSAIRMTGQPLFLNWAEGVVFIAIPASTDISEVDAHITKGTVYFAGVTYSTMSKYRSSVQTGVDTIPIVDQSRSPVFLSIAKWIKERLGK